MTGLLILGCGGHAKVVAETAISTGLFTSCTFLDDLFLPNYSPQTVLGWSLIGPLSLSLNAETLLSYSSAVVAIGNPAIRLHWIHLLQSFGYHLPVLIHPTAFISPSAHIGPASVVFAQVAVQAEVMIGTGTILNTGCSVDHDSQLSDGVHICPGARLAGEVQVGDRSWIGIGASVIQQVCIGADVTVGAGAAVLRNLPDGVTAVGVPARSIPST